MNRQQLLIAACIAASISVGLNVWFLMRKNSGPRKAAPITGSAAPGSVAPVLPASEIDFSGTAFADGSWKLTDDPDPAFDLEKPFDWNDVPAQGAGPDVSLTEQERENLKNQFEQMQAERRKGKRPVPRDLEPIPDETGPNDVRSKALLVPAPR